MKIIFALMYGFFGLGMIFAEEENRLQGGTLVDGKEGDPISKPWVVSKISSGVTVQWDKLPEDSQGRLWMHLVDDSDSGLCGLRQKFTDISKGRLSFRAYFKRLDGPFGVILTEVKSSQAENRVIDIKVESKQGLRVGDLGNRAKTHFRLETGKEYHFYCDFKPGEDQQSYEVTFGELNSGEVIYQTKTTSMKPLSNLVIKSDSQKVGLDAYVTDISLVPIP